jgi:hypothetical protein
MRCLGTAGVLNAPFDLFGQAIKMAHLCSKVDEPIRKQLACHLKKAKFSKDLKASFLRRGCVRYGELVEYER